MNPLYRPLDQSLSEIRLLKMKNVGEHEPITCNLVYHPLHTAPSFTALSYPWGEPSITKEDILLDGRQFAVTVNLASALRHARKHWSKAVPDRNDTDFLLWVDAVCINQQDIFEKDWQLPLMGTIYPTAQLVIAWLADNSRSTQLALETFDLLASESLTQSTEDFLSLEWMQNHPNLYKDDEDNKENNINTEKNNTNDVPAENENFSFKNERWLATSQFFGLPYWSRVWIFQEVVLARNLILCINDTSLKYQTLLQAWKSLLSIKSAIQSRNFAPHFLRCTAAWAFLSTKLWKWTTIRKISDAQELLAKTEGDCGAAKRFMLSLTGLELQAGDPKDHIYGLLGLSALKIVPKSGADVSVGEVYSEYISYWLRMYENSPGARLHEKQVLFFLYFGGNGVYDNPLDLPSWVPNFPAESKARTARSSPRPCGQADKGVFPALGDGPFIKDLSLFVPGLEVDHISLVQTKDSKGTRDEDWMLRYFEDYVSRAGTYPTGIPPLQAILRAHKFHSSNEVDENLVGYAFQMLLFHIPPPPPDDKDKEEHYRAHYRALGIEPLSGDGTGSKFNDSFIKKIFPGYPGRKLNWRDHFLLNRADLSNDVFTDWSAIRARWEFIETSNGYFGLGPLMAQPGDVIFVLKGSHLPVVLRKDGQHWVHVGCCFIIGLMNGEAAGRGSIQMVEIR